MNTAVPTLCVTCKNPTGGATYHVGGNGPECYGCHATRMAGMVNHGAAPSMDREFAEFRLRTRALMAVAEHAAEFLDSSELARADAIKRRIEKAVARQDFDAAEKMREEEKYLRGEWIRKFGANGTAKKLAAELRDAMQAVR